MINIPQAEKQLTLQDPLLGALISSQTIETKQPRTDYFTSLCSSIIGQQVSVAAANAILQRFKDATQCDPQKVRNITSDEAKTIGLSKQKYSYLTDLAIHFIDNPDLYNHLESQTDEAVITELTAVKGVGVWTAQMFLMFTLQRPDVFAPADVGLQRAMMQLYNWQTLPPAKELETIAEQWRPYRTVASWHLWHSLSNKPAQ